MTVFLIALTFLSVHAQDTERSRATLKGISAVSVLVEDLPEGAKALGLTSETI
jgi:hypothetical protein